MGPTSQMPGNMPYGDFVPHRFYKTKRQPSAYCAQYPFACTKNSVFTVLGTTKCDSPSGLCPEFQKMVITPYGDLFWRKINITDGEESCSKNEECQEFYNQFKQELGHAPGQPFFMTYPKKEN